MTLDQLVAARAVDYLQFLAALVYLFPVLLEPLMPEPVYAVVISCALLAFIVDGLVPPAHRDILEW